MGLKPGYKQTEVGVVPEDWEVSTVGAEFSIQLGKMLDAEKNFGVLMPFLGNRSVQWGRVDLTDIGEIKLTPADLRRFRLCEGDLLVCEGGEVGRAAIWHQPIEKCYYQKALHRLRPTRSYNVELMLYMLQRLVTAGFLLNFVTQTSIAHLPKDKFETVPIPLPPTKAEQESIVGALSDADALIESLEQLLAKKRHLKQGAMQELLTGKKRLPGFSGKWNKKRLGDIADTDPESLSSSTSAEYAFNYIALEDAEMGTLRSHTQQVFRSAPSRARRKLRKNDVVVSTVRPNLKSHFLFLSENGEWVCSTGFSVLRCKDRVAHPAYVFFHMFGDYIVRQIETLLTGSNYPAINSRDVRALDIPLPGYEEQNAIAAVLSDMDNEINTLDAKLTKAHQLKTGMMQELLTGKIRLIHSAASVLPFEVKQQADVSPSKAHNPQINEAVVLAVLASRFGTEKYPLARVRRTKLMYLFHRHADHEATGFLKKAAGPYDPKVRYAGPEKIALKNRYVRSHHNGTYEGFIPGDNIAQAEGYFEKWYDSPALEWVEQFRHKRTEELELLATIDMACVDLRREGKAVSLSTVKRVLQDNAEWKAKLDRPLFSDDKINTAIEQCQQLFPPEGDAE